MLYKNAIISDSLKLGASVLFQDVDMIWFRDPHEYLGAPVLIYDMQIMYDGPNPAYRSLHGNTGFVYVRPTESSQALFETALRNSASILAAGGHQYPFARILNFFVDHDLLKLHVVPEALFLNGHLSNLHRGVSPRAGNWKRDGVVLHYSWTGTREEKYEKLAEFGLNYLSPPPKPDRATTDHISTNENAVILADNEVRLTIHLAASESIELIVDRTAAILRIVLNALHAAERSPGDHSIIRLEIEDDGEPGEMYLCTSQISRIEITPSRTIPGSK